MGRQGDLAGTEGQRIRYTLPEGLRGLAALWVVLYHVSVSGRIDASIDQLPDPVASVVFEHGGLGVAVFFVLSGFVMAHTVGSRFDASFDPRVFAARRLLRITPPYYAAIGVAVAFAVLASRVGGTPFGVGGDDGTTPLTPGRLAAHLVYLQEIVGFENINDVFWTLSLEIQFYAVFVLLVLLTIRLRAWLDPGSALTVVMIPATAVSLLWPLGILPHNGRADVFWPVIHLFLLGAVAYWAQLGMLHPSLFAAAAVATATGLFTGPLAPFELAGLLSAAILYLAAERGRLDRWLRARPFPSLGTVSYSLYLVHTPVLGAVLAVLVGADRPASAPLGWVALLAGVVSSLLAATVFHVVVERPSTRLARSVGKPGPEGTSRTSQHVHRTNRYRKSRTQPAPR